MTLDSVAPELLNSKNLSDLDNPGSSIIINFDTSMLRSNYMIDEDQDESHLENDIINIEESKDMYTLKIYYI